MCLPSMVAVVVVAAGEELVLVLILLLKAQSRNLRHNNTEHREIVGLFNFSFTMDGGPGLPFFYVRAVFSLFPVV